MIREPKLAVFGVCWPLVAAGVSVCRGDAQVANDTYRSYYLHATIVSLDASQSLASYRSGGAVSGSPGSSLGCSTPEIDIEIQVLVKANRFYADVTLQQEEKVKEKTAANKAKKERIDLTDLRPRSIDLGADKDGRTYQLNLTPSVNIVQLTPEPFRKAADDLYRLRFHSSRIMLNDSQYIGRMLASDSQVFSMEVCGVASLEFSLRRLKDAKPWGRLQNGQITIRHPDGTTIEIGNVTNGADDRLIGDKAYQVWVRWEKPASTIEEYRAQLEGLRDKVKSGEMTLTDDVR